MPTNRDILDEHYKSGMHWKSVNIFNVLKAMDIFAKHEAIEFHKWVISQVHIHAFENPTPERFYELYLKSKL